MHELIQAAGLSHPGQITVHHIVRRTSDHKVLSLAQLVLLQLDDGILLQGELTHLPRICWPVGEVY